MTKTMKLKDIPIGKLFRHSSTERYLYIKDSETQFKAIFRLNGKECLYLPGNCLYNVKDHADRECAIYEFSVKEVVKTFKEVEVGEIFQYADVKIKKILHIEIEDCTYNGVIVSNRELVYFTDTDIVK